jgi:hypothetical protein
MDQLRIKKVLFASSALVIPSTFTVNAVSRQHRQVQFVKRIQYARNKSVRSLNEIEGLFSLADSSHLEFNPE